MATYYTIWSEVAGLLSGCGIIDKRLFLWHLMEFGKFERTMRGVRSETFPGKRIAYRRVVMPELSAVRST